MRAALRSELVKQHTTKTALGLLGAMIGLVLASVLLHGFGFSTHQLSLRSNQRRVFVEAGESLGAVGGGLIGAMSITAEIRHGTIRTEPTRSFGLLLDPDTQQQALTWADKHPHTGKRLTRTLMHDVEGSSKSTHE